MTSENENRALQLQQLGQVFQNIILQKETLKTQLMEIKESLKEIKPEDTIFKSVGLLIINKNYEEVKKDLSEEEENVNLKIKALEKQENTLKGRIEELQKKIAKDGG